MILCIAAVMFSQTAVGPAVEFPSHQYPYSQIAKILSVGGETVQCDPGIRDRVAAMSLRGRQPEEMRNLIAKSLDLEFERVGPGKLRMKLSKKAAQYEKCSLETYCSEYDENSRAAISKALPSLGAQRDLQRARQANADANRVLYNRESYDDAQVLGAALVSAFNQSERIPATVAEFLTHGSLKDILISPSFTTAILQDLPTDSRFPRSVQEYQPLWQIDPSATDEEVARQKSDFRAKMGFASGEAFDFHSGGLTFWESEFSSGMRGVDFHPPWQPEVVGIKTQLLDPDTKSAFDSTRKFLRSPDAAAILGQLPTKSISVALLRWAKTTGRELVAEASPQRDKTFLDQGTLTNLYEPNWVFRPDGDQIIARASSRSASLSGSELFWLALRTDGEMLIARNLMSFLDNAVDPPATALHTLLAGSDTVSQPSMADIETTVGSLTESELDRAMAADCAYFADGFRDAIPFFRLIAGLPLDQRTEVNRILESGNGARASLLATSSKIRQRFAQDLRSAYLWHHSPPLDHQTQFLGEEFYPLFDPSSAGGHLEILRGAGKEAESVVFQVEWSPGSNKLSEEPHAVEPISPNDKPAFLWPVSGTHVLVNWPRPPDRKQGHSST